MRIPGLCLAAALVVLATALAVPPAGAQDANRDQAGSFDHYILSLSWSPTWCALEGDARGADQCDPRHDHGWTLHGLWPQYDRGWPSFCRSAEAPPTRTMTAAMADIMGSSGLAWHQWRKHGACSGLSPSAYFALSRRAYAGIRIPEVFSRLDRPVLLPAKVVEEAFLKANPGLAPDMVTVTCKDAYIQEVRLCLSRDDLAPIPCGPDTRRDCTLSEARLDPVR